jgi:hypothetical protein
MLLVVGSHFALVVVTLWLSLRFGCRYADLLLMPTIKGRGATDKNS